MKADKIISANGIINFAISTNFRSNKKKTVYAHNANRKAINLSAYLKTPVQRIGREIME